MVWISLIFPGEQEELFSVTAGELGSASLHTNNGAPAGPRAAAFITKTGMHDFKYTSLRVVEVFSGSYAFA